MQAFIIMALGVMLATFGVQEYKNHSLTSSQDLLQINSMNLANNFYIYNDLAVNYITFNYTTFYDPNPSSSIFYNQNYGFDYTKIEPTKYYNYKPAFNFKSAPVELTFSSPNETESSNLIPVMYLLTTFDTATTTGSSSLGNEQLIVNMLGNFSSMITGKNYKGDSTYWTNAIYGRIDTNCNVATLYSKTTNDKEETAINTQVKNICLYLQTKKFTMSRFFYFTPIYPNN